MPIRNDEDQRGKNLTRKGRHGAGGDGLGGLLDLDEAHAAVAGDGEAAVVAEPRDVDAGDLAGLEDSEALGDLHRVAIDEDLDGVLRSRAGEVDSCPGDRQPRRENLLRQRLRRRRSRLVGVLELRRGGDGPEEEGPRAEEFRGRGCGSDDPGSQQSQPHFCSCRAC